MSSRLTEYAVSLSNEGDVDTKSNALVVLADRVYCQSFQCWRQRLKKEDVIEFYYAKHCFVT